MPWQQPGHAADSPAEIPPLGWWQVTVRVYNESMRDNVMVVAAGVAFFALLALFPFITALVSTFGLIADRSTVEQQMAALQGVVPAEAFALMREQVVAVATADSAALGLSSLVGFGFAVWSSSAGVKTLFSALNIAYEEEEQRSILAFQGQALLFTFGIILSVVMGLLVIIGLPAVLGTFGLAESTRWLVRGAGWVLLLAVVLATISLLYRFGPSRRSAAWSWLTPGALFSTVLLVLTSMGFSFYAANFASYNETYGALGGVIITMMWLWISSMVVLVGAELNAELELQTGKDTTSGRPRPKGRRGAYVADHTAEVHHRRPPPEPEDQDDRL